ncbi:MAG: TonB-dependent receptor [Balneolaceae bacterium]|nr:TonB-dependent receptor [Balneolaceae bacterium]
MNKTCLLAALLMLPGLLSAQDSTAAVGDTLATHLKAIEVVGVRSVISSADAPLALAIANRDRASLNHGSSLSLSGIGQQLPGLWVNNRRNYALGERMTIRGLGWRAAFGVRGIQVILDGVPLTVADGQSMINIVDPAFVRRAELIRGPASSFWGNASGGVLYLSTDPGYSAGDGLHLRALGGSYGMARTEAQYRQAGERHAFSAYGSFLDDPGFRNYSSARLWRGGLTGRVEISGGGTLEYSGAMVHMPFAEHPSGLSRQQAKEEPRTAVPSFVEAGAGKSMTQGQAGLRYLADTGLGDLTLSAYGIRRDLRNPLPFAIITVDRLSGGLRAGLEREYDEITWKAGAEVKLQRDDRVEFGNDSGSRGGVQIDQLETVWNQALFASAAWGPGDLALLGSLRLDRLAFASDARASGAEGERSFQALSPGVGVRWDLGAASLFANLGTSFEAPTTTELVNRPGGGEGFNPDIRPEHTTSVDLGMRGELVNSPLSWELTLYQMWIRDLLFPYQLAADGPVFYRNQGETRHRGVEARVEARILPSLTLSSTWNLTDAAFVEAATLDGFSLAGKSVPGVARHRLNTTLRWQASGWRASLSHEMVSRHPVDNLNTAWNDRYQVLDARLSYRSNPGAGSGLTLHPFLEVNNVLDHRYNGSVVVNAFGGRYYEPAAGRNWTFGLSLDF